MRKLILGLLGATGLAFASAAGATTSITPTEMIKASDEGGIMTFTTPGPDADGVITASFGHSGILAGDFIDYFLFTIDDDGIGSGSLSTSSSFINGLLVNSTNLDITGVFVNNILADLVLKDKDGNGKKLGFISQEIGREINTMGSKANDANIQQIVVGMKEELEKIKEQLLNVL